MRKVILFLASGFGSGYLPSVPGTWGSLVGLLLYWPLQRLAPLPLGATVLAVAFLSCWIAGLAEGFLGAKDPQIVVIDEVAGMFFSLVFLPFSWKIGLAGFFLFRLFDVWKPFPARLIQDKLPGGWGVVGDDLMAGIYANLVLQIAIRVVPGIWA
ncbi:MAG TPA: phosphatidylglycerophosphatase A [bacterium]|nr:phosphatidylglycerophosphatase A [bacterium]